MKEIQKFFLYHLRWQLSTVIFAPIIAYFKHSPKLWGTREDWVAVIVANLIGASIFFWVDKFIFRSNTKQIAEWEIIQTGKCHDCGKEDFVRRLIKGPGGYDRTNDKNPEYRCQECSDKKLRQLIVDKEVAF